MTSHIVISREELYDQLHRAFDAGWSKGSPSSSVENLVEKLDTRFVDWVNSRTVRVAHTFPSGWLPIDQAPKDGTFVVLAHKNEDYWHREECCWNTDVKEWVTAYYQPYNRCGQEPTHFLPLIQPE